MADFKRARSCEQKEQRMNEIKTAADQLFSQMPYPEITLTTIAERLGWSRANLYKYVTTKEEIFLAITADKRDAYTAALLAALPAGCGFSNETIAEVWAGLATAHRDYFRYGGMLFTVIETNVSVEKLTEFKRGYYRDLETVREQLGSVLGVDNDLVERLVNSVYSHGVGLAGSCMNNPLVVEAVANLGIVRPKIDFQSDMRDFIAMTIAWYQAKR